MRIDRDGAREIAEIFLAGLGLERYGYRPAVNSDGIIEFRDGFSVPWNSAEFLETGNFSYMLAGNIPLFVDASTGECRYMDPNDGDDFKG